MNIFEMYVSGLGVVREYLILALRDEKGKEGNRGA